MKKILCLISCIILSFSICVNTFAFTDISESNSYLEAIELLSDLDILNGYEDGTFRPDATITRAEMAKILVSTLNGKSFANGMTKQNTFIDVPENHWAAGYVNYAESIEVVSGRGEGIYDPEAPVTYAEAIKLVVAALGYTPVANIKGGYPDGYLYVANNMLKITKGIVGDTNSPATRGMVAKLLFNSLETKIMEQDSWSALNPEYIQGERTFLRDYLEVTKVEGVVTETFYSETTVDKENQTIEILTSSIDGYTAKNFDDRDSDYVFDTEPGDTYTFEVNGTGAETYFSYTITAYVRDFEGEDELVAIAPKGNKNTTLEIAFDKFEDCEITEKTKYVLFEYFENLDDEKPATAKHSNKLIYYVNGVEKNSYTIDTDKDGYIRFLDNNGDGVYDYAFVEEVTDELAVKAINEKSHRITAKGTGSITLDPKDEDKYITFVKDNEIVDFDAIAEDDILSIVELYDGNVIKVYISSDTVEGRVTSTTGGKYKIAGNKYHKSTDCGTISKGDEGIFYLNYNGKIAYKEAEKVSGGNYAFVLDVDTSEPMFGTPVYTILMMNTSGKWMEIEFAEKVSFYYGSDKVGTIKFEDGLDAIDELSKGYFVADGEEIAMGDIVNHRIIKYTLNSTGELSSISIPLSANGKVNEEDFSIVEAFVDEEYDANRDRFAGIVGKGTINNDSAVFVIDDEITEISKKSQVSMDINLKDEELYSGIAFDCVDGIYQCMVITNTESAIADDAMFVIVKEITEDINDDDDAYYIIEGYSNGKEVSYETTTTDEFDIVLDELVEGSVIEVAFNKDNLVDDVNVITFEDNDTNYDYEDEDGVAYFCGYLVDEELDGNYTFVGEHEINVKNANITYVDTTGRKYKYTLDENIEDYLGSIIYADEDETIFDDEAMKEETVYVALAKVVDGYAIDIVIYGIEYTLD